jgi:predicted ribosome quality control (RQC) complex YloA/Tae2 family protein
VVGRDEGENKRILMLVRQGDVLFEVKGYGSPVTLLRGEAGEEDIRLAAAITARYSDAKRQSKVAVHHEQDYAGLSQAVLVSPLEDKLAKLRI